MLGYPVDEFQLEHHTMLASVTDHLRSLILSRRLASGERLVQSELAKRLGVSRTPIREALQKLASEGLVTFCPYKGAMVAKLSLSDVEEIYAVRTALECQVGYLAAQHITEEELEHLEDILLHMGEALAQGELQHLLELNRQFNCTVFAASRQSRLYELTVKYMHLADLYRRMHYSVEPLAAEGVAENRALLVSLRRRDPEAVARLTRVQLQRSVTALREFIEGG